MKTKSNDGFFMAAMLMIVLFFGIGWCMNLYKLVQCDFETPLKAEAIRGVGVFVPPVGAIAGWFDIED